MLLSQYDCKVSLHVLCNLYFMSYKISYIYITTKYLVYFTILLTSYVLFELNDKVCIYFFPVHWILSMNICFDWVVF